MSDLETEKRQMRDISSTEGGKNEGTGTHQQTDKKKKKTRYWDRKFLALL